jgi:hypothetical protein
MGLDMYLHARRYTSSHFEPELFGQLQALKIPFQKAPDSITVEADAAYWRKCNAIHGWFVREVQDGKDDCAYYYVSSEKLRELRDLCQQIKDTYTKDRKAGIEMIKEKLPPTSGFFFGGDSIDDDFVESEIDDTISQLTTILDHPAADQFEYQYHSSW